MKKNSLIAVLLFLQLLLCSCGQRETGADNRMNGMENVPEQAEVTEDTRYNVFYLMHGGWENPAYDYCVPNL